MSNKILYEPTEGTTGFWGLRNVPRQPCLEKCEHTSYCLDSCEKDGDYCESLESCKSNKLEIVNPEVIPNVPLWPGDIFDLPIGYALQELYETRYQWAKNWIPCSKEYWDTSTDEKRLVLRLVKTETKEHSVTGPWDCQDQKVLDEFYGAQPEPEESQTPIFDEMLRKYFDYRYHREMSGHQACAELQKEFIIQRKKQ